jgi:hypothetical protein
MNSAALTKSTVSSKYGYEVTCLRIEQVRVEGVVAEHDSAVDEIVRRHQWGALSTEDYRSACDDVFERTIGSL